VLRQRQHPVQKRQRHRINIPERDDLQVVAVLADSHKSLCVYTPNSERIRYPEVYSSQNIDDSLILMTNIGEYCNFHPYHIAQTQVLTPNDIRRRLVFCNWAQTMLQLYILQICIV